MKILKAYKVELDPNDKQRSAFMRAAGCARKAYNWGLEQKIKAFELRKAAIAAGVPAADAPKIPTAIDLHKMLNKLKKLPEEQGGMPWMYEVCKSAPQEALRNLDRAFANFFRRCKNKTKGPKGFPQFKSRKKHGIGGFRFGETGVTDTHIKIPRIKEPVRLKEHRYLPVKSSNIHVLSTTVSEKAGRWFCSVQVGQEIPDPEARSHLPVIGVDAGLKVLAACSDGTVFANPKALAGGLRQLRKLQKSVSRKVKDSNNSRKAKKKVARHHYRISCVRKDALHKCSDAITKRASIVVIEDLNVAGMLKNPNLARAVADASMAELHRQIEYKAAWRGVSVVTASRWFPSSKTCSACGQIKSKLLLGDRKYICEFCGLSEDRDFNASINLRGLATGSSSASACQGVCSGFSSNAGTKQPR